MPGNRLFQWIFSFFEEGSSGWTNDYLPAKVASFTEYDVKHLVYGFAWNEPGIQGFPKKFLIASCGAALPNDPHVKKRWRVDEVTGMTTKSPCTSPSQ
jgi:hypothetical protein